MKKILTFILPILYLSFIPASPYEQKETAPELEKTINDFLSKWDIPGASLAIGKNGKLIYSKGFGYADLEIKEPVLPSHLFRIASISKMITATAILKLVEKGDLDLDDKVFGKNGVLNDKSFNESIVDKRIYSVTVKQLLQHTAGWDRDQSGDPMFNHQIVKKLGAAAPADQHQIIHLFLQKKLNFLPGSRYSYSNFGYSILGRIIEKKSEQKYDEYVRKAILRPIGINSMQIGKNLFCEKVENETSYYDKRTTESCYADASMVCWPYGGFNLPAMDSHGGWIASAPDLIKFLAVIDGNPSVSDILNNTSLQAMRTPSDICQDYGLGCQINKAGNIWHTGSLPGSSSFAAVLNNGISWVILLNSNPPDANYFSALDKLLWNSLKALEKNDKPDA